MLMYLAMLCLVSGSIGRSDNVGSFQPRSKTSWGDWGNIEWCPEGMYANEFQLKVEYDQGPDDDEDDTALNGIRLRCSSPCGASSPAYISSTVGPWGGWTKMRGCPLPYSFISGAQVNSERDLGSGEDDTATNDYNFACTPSQSNANRIYGDGEDFGTWSEWENCPSGSYVCGLKTRIEPEQGSDDDEDDTALNDAIFYCCSMKLSPVCKEVYESRVPKDFLG